MNLTESLLLYLCIFITLSSIIKIIFRPKGKSIPITQISGFENDILFINNLIAVQLKNYEKYIIAPAKAGKRILNDDELKKYREDLVIEIFSHISEDYKRTLLHYFSDEGLRYYVANTLNNEIISLTLKYNLNFFSGMNNNEEKNKDITNVHRTDI